MHLKTLTLRGFKSFASATTLEFEPGITCVVGPNGSGKSNVVDALAWVMGEQGAKTLRGGKMEDVIFAGTSTRQALGRAEVSLTIDNSDGALPIDYTEVTITRTLFRSGGSEYAINNAPARLLDIQELLSDSGLGREMHVIVGQGQLDAVLRATPEDRRGFIEEAAGVLKHRRRKEKAVRKLQGMQANLDRLADLTAELARQLGPLGRQAEAARRARTVQIDVRDAGARLLADDLARAQAQLAEGSGSQADLKERQASAEAALAAAEAERRRVDEQVGLTARAVDAAKDTWYRASTAAQAVEALLTRARERAELLSQQTEARHGGRDPEELEAQAAQVAENLERERASAELAETALLAAKDAKASADAAFRAEDQRLSDAARAAADRREQLAQLTGRVDSSASRLEAASAERERQAEQRAATLERRVKLQAEYTTAEHEALGVDEGEEGLDARHEAAEAKTAAAREQVEFHERAHAELTSRREALMARAEALRIGLDRSDVLGTVLAEKPDGVLAQVADILDVDPGFEDAIAAALGPVALGLVVADAASAGGLFDQLREREGAVLEVLYPDAGEKRAPARRPATLPKGAAWAPDVCRVTAKGEAGRVATLALLENRLGGVVILPDDPSVAPDAVLRDYPDLLAVTRSGDVYAVGHARGGQSGEGQLLALRAAHEETLARIETADHERQRASFALDGARGELATHESEAEAALAELHASDARIAAVAERLGRLGQSIRAATEDLERMEGLAARTEEEIARHERALAEARGRLEDAANAPADEAEPDTTAREDLRVIAEDRSTAVMDATIALRSVEGQVDFLDKRVKSLHESARRERRARAEAERAAEARRRQAAAAAEVARLADLLNAHAPGIVERARAEQAEAEESRADLEAARTGSATAVDRARATLDEVTSLVHRDDVARAEVTYRYETLATRAGEEFSMTAGDLLEAYGPHLPVPVPEGEPVPYVRAEQEKRLKQANKDLARIGQVNPLALEEFAALEERHTYLQKQLEDVKKSRSDLMGIVRDVDRHVEEVFTAAYHDTARQFEGVFSRLFPGGEGRLVLTDPSDMLTTGIEVEARPAGKKVKRLSLLSGGERSLTAVAILVAIFKARPSPFYVMDEVEAALDDTNLSRLITIFEELRAGSQLIVITHQKRTMEVADALYGVTMQGDGITTVISQRIPREQPEGQAQAVPAD